MTTKIIKQAGRYTRLDDGTTWPTPTEVANLAWRLRYAREGIDGLDMLLAASVCELYARRQAFPTVLRGK